MTKAKAKKKARTALAINDMYHFVKTHIQDDYAMSVLYYEIRKALLSNHFNLASLSTLEISQRFMEDGNINISHTYNNVEYSLALLLSVRALMLNKSLIQYCHDDYLLYHPLERYDFSDILWYSSLLLDYLKDNDFITIFRLLIKVYKEEAITSSDIEDFNSFTQKPEERNLRNYFRKVSKSGKNSEELIGDCAFLMDNTITDYTVTNNIKYIGDTAFAFCASLQTLKIEGEKVMFGRFPIIECDKLTHIYVPTGTTEFYKESLPYYSSIISVEGEEDVPQMTDVVNDSQNNDTAKEQITVSEGELNSEDEDNQEDDNSELTDQEKKVVRDIVNVTVNQIEKGKRPRITDAGVSNGKSFSDTSKLIEETNQDYKLHQLVKGTITAKNANDYTVQLENGKTVSIPLKDWKTRLSVVGKKMVLKKEGYDYYSHRTQWRVMTVI